MHFREFARTKFPTASPPNEDASGIIGNVSLDDKQLCANIMAYHVANYPGSTVFGHNEAKGLKLVELWVKKVGMGAESGSNPARIGAQTVIEISVEEGMLNVHGAFAGPCATLILDVATFCPIFVLSLLSGAYAAGVSMAMHTVWHAPAFLGTELRLVSTSLSVGGRISVSRCEIYDKKTKKMLISATQTIAPPRLSPSTKATKPKEPQTKL
ncbi:hypothetical protein B0H21DRAFT_779999 [Amylocystis lapponica]|nr:hypothetical protein B0H21DRAFT_779999 [Amylocystis lapponica]